jgi:hypothetical protein
MSREQLVDAYLRGEISRRVLIRRLVAAGVSLTAAVAYSYLAPDRVIASPGSYNLSDETQPSPSPPPPPPHPDRATARRGPALTLQASRSSGRVRAKVSSDEAANFVVSAVTRSGALATKSFRVRSAGTKSLTLRLPQGAPRRIAVVARATDDAGLSSKVQVTLGAR